MGATACFLHIVLCGRIRGALVEGHGHIRPERHLNLHRAFGGEQDAAAIAWVAEVHAVVVDPIEVTQAEHLETTGIGEHRSVPVHEAMQSASGFDHRFSRLEMQVIGVGKHHLSAGGCELIRGHALHRGQGAHGHEAWCGDGAVGRGEAAAARRRALALIRDCEVEHPPLRPRSEPTVSASPCGRRPAVELSFLAA